MASNTYLRGVLGFKGERGYSAYDIAVKYGFKGTEQDWLATIGKASIFDTNRTLYTTTAANETTFDLPSAYLGSDQSAISVFVNGISIKQNAYTVNEETKKVTLTTPLEKTGTEVEIVCSTLSTNALPIVETIDSESTNETTPGTKAVYDYVRLMKKDIEDSQVDKANIQVVSGFKSDIAAGATETVDINYPSEFTKSNTLIIGKTVLSNGNCFDINDITDTTNDFPVIKQIALTENGIRVWLKNNSLAEPKTGYFKITLLKVS